MTRLPVAGLLVALGIFVVDQAAKWYVTGPLGIDFLGASREILPIFDVRFVLNCGVSLGLLRGDSAATRWALVALTGLIAVGVAVWMTREKSAIDRAALGCVLGGALGNISDRAVPPGVLHKAFDMELPYPGCVVDYAGLHFGSWYPFLIFNVADAAITIGVVVLFARAFLVRDKARDHDKDGQVSEQVSGQGPVENSHA